jgi:flagellar basal body-associated protein FliL/DNA-dependent RNA polymerase auxiliary subunit epsilon
MESSKNHANYVIVLLTLILAISCPAYALSEDFNLFGSSAQIDVCACDLRTGQLTAENNGEVTSTLMLSLSGEAAEWTNIAPQTFYLEPGELKNIEQFIKVPCGARGEYTLNTTIRSLFDTVKILEQKVNVQNCPNVQINPKFSGAQNECPCTPVQYDFDVINTGNHVEIYEISVEPYSDAISLSTDILILEPGEKQAVTVFINLECGNYGEKKFTFNAMAQGTSVVGQTEFTLEINKCYDYDFAAETEYSICQGVSNIIPIQIKNNAGIANTYTISTQGIEWAYPENTTVSTWGGETVNSSIILDAPTDDEGKYTLTLTTTSARGDEIRSQDITITTEKCHDYQIVESDSLKLLECESQETSLLLKNIGAREATYYVDLEGVEWLTTSSDAITIAAGEEAEIPITADTPCNAAGDYAENVYVTIEDINQTYVEQKTVSVYTKEDAYLPVVTADDLTVDYAGGETEIKITNKGIADATYELSLTASDWITIDQTSAELAPGDNTTVVLSAYPTEDVLEDSYSAELVLRISEEDIEYSKELLVTVGQKSTPIWVWVAIAGGIIILAIIMITAIILLKKKGETKKPEEGDETKPSKEAITINKREYRKEKKEEKKVKALPIILLIALIALLAAAGYYAMSKGIFSAETNETTDLNKTTADIPTEETTEQTETEQQTTETSTETITPEETETGVLTNADVQEPLITIDRSNVPGEGNTIRVTNATEITLPLSVKNPTDRKARFAVNTTEGSWVTFEQQQITILPNSETQTNIRITPNMDLLKENDYSITIDTTLEGKKIDYEETIEIVITSKESTIKQYLKWLLAGLAGLLVLILLISLIARSGPEMPSINRSEDAVEEKRPRKKKEISETAEEKKSAVPAIIGIILAILVIAALSFWAYNTFFTTSDTESVDTPEETPAEQTTAPEQNQTVTEPKLTEDDVQESLIQIDRSTVAGEGNELKVDQESYSIPLSIKNPTDRKARFTVNTSNESWISFEQYMILVEPNSTKNININLNPDLDALKTNDYMITINTKLEGQKIDYEEELSFVLKDNKRFEMKYWMYIILGLIIIGSIILVSEISKRNKSNPAKTEKNEPIKAKKEKKDRVKTTEGINKDIAELRKKTVLKIRKGSM